jgi:hypothetical protein
MKASEVWAMASEQSRPHDIGAWAADRIQAHLGHAPYHGASGHTVAIVGSGPGINSRGIIDEICNVRPAVVVGLNAAAAWVGKHGPRNGWRTVGRFQDWPGKIPPTDGLDDVVAMSGYSPARIPWATIIPNPYPIGPMCSALCAVVEARASCASRVIFFACDSVRGSNQNAITGDAGKYRMYAILAALAAGDTPIEWRCPEPDDAFAAEVEAARAGTPRLAIHSDWLGK